MKKTLIFIIACLIVNLSFSQDKYVKRAQSNGYNSDFTYDVSIGDYGIVTLDDLNKYFRKHSELKLIDISSSEVWEAGFKSNNVSWFKFTDYAGQQKYQAQKEQSTVNSAFMCKAGCPPDMTKYTVQNLLSQCPSQKDVIEEKYYSLVEFGCFTYESYLELFPSGKNSDKARNYLVLKAQGNAPKTFIESAMSYTGDVVIATVDMYQKAWEDKDNWGHRDAKSSDFSKVSESNVSKFEMWKTQYKSADYKTDELYLSVGCNDYKHKLFDENSGFSITIYSNGKTTTINKDLASYDAEVQLSSYDFKSGAQITISFTGTHYSEKFVSLTLSFSTGGHYRIEVYPN